MYKAPIVALRLPPGHAVDLAFTHEIPPIFLGETIKGVVRIYQISLLSFVHSRLKHFG